MNAAAPHSNTNAVLPTSIPRWRYALIVLGVALGLSCGFATMFNASLPFFLIPIGQEFGLGRGDTSAAAVLAMLGVAMASPFVGRLFDRFSPERVIGISVLLFAAGTYAMSRLPPSLIALGALFLGLGVAGSATTMIGYASVLPRWFDGRLGLALGLAGLGAGLGIGLSPFIATRLIADVGWRDAYAVLAAIAFGVGMVAYLLIRPGRGEVPPLATKTNAKGTAAAASGTASNGFQGLSLKQALRDPRFWLLLVVTFMVPYSILGIALHGAALFMDRGLSAQQAAIGAALAGLGAIAARVGVGALLDRFHAPYVAALIFVAAGAGLVLNSSATSFAVLSIGTFLGGVAMGAEGDLLPFMVRRYFGMRAFGAVFGSMHSAYALGGVLGPIAYGYTFDRFSTYSPMMIVCAVLCCICAVAVVWMGAYRYGAKAHRA